MPQLPCNPAALSRLRAAILHATILGTLLGPFFGPALAAEGELASVDPPSCNQGDTLLLTLRGRDLPTGAVVVEFFPQQIAVLSLLSASSMEIMAQIKVPALAPPGKYNIIIYNQLGEEVVGNAVFTVLSDLVTPVFKDYDPKVIAQASSAFAVVLSGEMVSRDAVEHMSVQWSQAGQAVDKLESSFAYASPTAVSVAVTGSLPAGRLDGRIMLDDKPIYFISIELPGARPDVYGHSPSRLPLGGEVLRVKLIGASFNQALLPRLSALLTQLPPSKRVKPQQFRGSIELLDEAALQLSFSTEAPPGPYTVQLQLDGAPFYSGKLELLPADAEPPAEEAPIGPPVVSATGSEGPDSSSMFLPIDGETTDPPAGEVGPIDGSELITPDSGLQPEIPGGAEPPPLPLPLMDVEPAAIRPRETARFTLQLDSLDSDVLDRLVLSLEGEGWQAAPLVQGTRDGNLVAVFELPERDWQPADAARLRITDPAGIYAAHVQQITLLLEAADASAPPGAAQRYAKPPPPGRHAVDKPDGDPAGLRPEGHSVDEPDTSASELVAADGVPTQTEAAVEEPAAPSEPAAVEDGGAEAPGDVAQGQGAGVVEVATSSASAAGEHEASPSPDTTEAAPASTAEAAQPQPELAPVYLLEQTTVIGPSGFALLLATSLSASAEQWSALNLLSEDLLLGANAEKFRTQARLLPRASQTLLELTFTPQAGAFDPLAWELLVDSLCSGQPVAFTLKWAEPAVEVSSAVLFERAAPVTVE